MPRSVAACESGCGSRVARFPMMYGETAAVSTVRGSLRSRERDGNRSPDSMADRTSTSSVGWQPNRSMTDGAHRDWRFSARDQHLRSLARDPRGVRVGRRLAGADHRARACGSGARHEPPDRGVHRRGGTLRAPPAAHDLGLGIAVVLRHRARLRAHRRGSFSTGCGPRGPSTPSTSACTGRW